MTDEEKTEAEKKKHEEEKKAFVASMISLFDATVISKEEALERDREIAEESKQRYLKERSEVYRNSGVDLKYHNVSLKDLLPTLSNEQQKVITDFLDDVEAGKQRVLWLVGNPGTGKTALADAVLRNLILRGKSGCHYLSNDLMQRIKTAEGYGVRETVDDVKRGLLKKDVIVFDDVGQEYYREYAQYQYFDLVQKLTANGKSFVMTSNISKNDFGNKFLGHAVVDRLKGHCKAIEFTGESYRGTDKELYVL